ncbi:MAG: hypothetical protein SCALA702_23130 [Melioribacteraceae bacterium]|nr:MAG: hypothetical protein SCALA702_23130 [Melioribacteraceae bacterium]
MLKNSLVILSLILMSTACYTIREHPVVKGVVDGQYHAQRVDYTDDCAECHSTGEIDEFDLMPLYSPEKTYGDMKFYSDSLSNIALFYGEVGWWYRFTPMVYEYTDGGYTENEEGYFVPSRGYNSSAPPVIYPGTPTQSGSSGTKTKERTNTNPSGDGSNNAKRSSADRPNDPGKSRNSNNGRKSGRK